MGLCLPNTGQGNKRSIEGRQEWEAANASRESSREAPAEGGCDNQASSRRLMPGCVWRPGRPARLGRIAAAIFRHGIAPALLQIAAAAAAGVKPFEAVRFTLVDFFEVVVVPNGLLAQRISGPPRPDALRQAYNSSHHRHYPPRISKPDHAKRNAAAIVPLRRILRFVY